MIRTRRALAAFLLALAMALPAAALPPERPEPRAGFLASLWQRLAPVLAIFDASRSNMDPNGTPNQGPVTTQDDGDSRSSMDPDG